MKRFKEDRQFLLQVKTRLRISYFLASSRCCHVYSSIVLCTLHLEGLHAAIVTLIIDTSRSTVWTPTDIKYNCYKYNLPLLFYTQEITVNEIRLNSLHSFPQTQEVQKAMDEKRFEEAVKLRGRYDWRPAGTKSNIPKPSLHWRSRHGNQFDVAYCRQV